MELEKKKFHSSLFPSLSNYVIHNSQNFVLSENLFSLGLDSQPNSEMIFKKKAIEQLQLRSLCLVNTKEFYEFEKRFSLRAGSFSLDTIYRTFDLCTQSKSEIKSEEKQEQSQIDTVLIKLLKENEISKKVEERKQLKNDLNKNELGKEKENLTQSISETVQSKALNYSKTEALEWLPVFPSDNNHQFDQSIRKELKRLVLIVLSNMGKNNNKEIECFRNFYIHNTLLLQAYDALVKKYYSSKKVKEDIVRYIIRKMLKSTKLSLKQTSRVKGTKASVILYKRYFPGQFDLLNNTESLDSYREQELLELIMPYSPKSKNKTINNKFIQEIFSSEVFLKDYQEFLDKIDYLLFEDNRKKLEKMLDVLQKCVKSNNFKNIGSLKVFPWLDTWIEDTKKAAIELWKNKK